MTDLRMTTTALMARLRAEQNNDACEACEAFAIAHFAPGEGVVDDDRASRSPGERLSGYARWGFGLRPDGVPWAEHAYVGYGYRGALRAAWRDPAYCATERVPSRLAIAAMQAAGWQPGRWDPAASVWQLA